MAGRGSRKLAGWRARRQLGHLMSDPAARTPAPSMTTPFARLVRGARAWHEENADRDRPTRKAKSLADWRAAR